MEPPQLNSMNSDYMNQYCALWTCVQEGRTKRVQRFSEACDPAELFSHDPQKVKELNDLADRCNELQDPLNRMKLKEATIRAAEICNGAEGKKIWENYLLNK